MFEKAGSYKLSGPEYREIKDQMQEKLGTLQRRIIAAKIPVIVLFEGFSASGKGTAISSLILNLDPRGFATYTTRKPTADEKRLPWMQRFAEKAPEKGRIAVFDRAWYSGLSWIEGDDTSEKSVLPYLEDINVFERQLTDDGVVIIKIFLYIPKKEQKKRMEALKADKNTAWRVTKADEDHLKNYDRNERFYKAMITVTDTPYAKWNVIYAKDRRYTRAKVMQTVASALEEALKAQPKADVPEIQPKISERYRLLPAPRIEDMDLNKTMTREEYDKKLESLQNELSELHNVIYRKKIPVIIAYEGNDAAGKGGSIRRVARALDPRGYMVHPIAGPTVEEKSHHHLWRFYTRLPRTGHIAIFDRTWYGRVLVERVEHFTPNIRVQEGYQEINEFEYMLYKWGAVLVKFWLAIDSDEQLRRFQDRQNNPLKQWKITDEDWRNRDKWNDYVIAVDDMIKYTNTDFAPWTIVEADSKYYARIKTLQTIIDAIKNRIGK